MPDPHDEHHQDLILNVVNHAVVADPDPVGVFGSDQLLATIWARIVLQIGNFGDDPGNPFPVDPAQILGGGSGKLNPLGGHQLPIVF